MDWIHIHHPYDKTEQGKISKCFFHLSFSYGIYDTHYIAKNVSKRLSSPASISSRFLLFFINVCTVFGMEFSEKKSSNFLWMYWHTLTFLLFALDLCVSIFFFCCRQHRQCIYARNWNCFLWYAWNMLPWFIMCCIWNTYVLVAEKLGHTRFIVVR